MLGIIKLRIVDDNGLSHIHRVHHSYIQEENGSISFQNLVGVAIQLRFSNTLLSSDECHVIFKYYDIDNECVTISSTTELFDAIDKFEKSKRVLRVTANVRRKTSYIKETNNKDAEEPTTFDEMIGENDETPIDETPNLFFRAFASLFINDEHNSTTKKSNERPFLHCRHTCDECRCTPIVGPRYHAAPDVDLCTKCYKNYNGNEFDFVLEEQGKW